MFRLQVVRVVFLVLSAATIAFGQTQQPPGKTETPDQAASGSITGRVINENGQPLPNAIVQVRALNSAGPGQMVSTDREGEFGVSGLDRGSYSVWAALAAYTPAPRDPLTQAPAYHIGDSVTLTLIKGGVVTGTVTNAAGEPIVGINVRAQMTRDGNGKRLTAGFLREKLTDDRGIYRIYGLRPGMYVVSAGGAGAYASQDGNIFATDVPTFAPSATRDSATELNVHVGEEIPSVDIRYRGEQGRTVSGAVKGPADGSFDVMLSASSDSPIQWTHSYQTPGTPGFQFDGVADGEYQLLALSYSRTGRELSAAMKRIVVKGADVSGIELTTIPLATISGRVVLEETKATECVDKDKQQPEFKEIIVSAWHNDNEAAKETPSTLWSVGAPVPPDADGSFRLRNLAAGEYYFATRFTGKYWYLQSIAFAPPPNAAAKPAANAAVWTKVKAGDRLTGLTVTLAEGAASLRAQLVSEGQQVPEKLFLYLVPSEREKADALLRYYAAPVNPDGKIALHNIAPGHYWLVVQQFSDEVGTPLTKLRHPDASELRARLRREAEAAKTEIEFKPCQNVIDFKFPFKP